MEYFARFTNFEKLTGIPYNSLLSIDNNIRKMEMKLGLNNPPSETAPKAPTKLKPRRDERPIKTENSKNEQENPEIFEIKKIVTLPIKPEQNLNDPKMKKSNSLHKSLRNADLKDITKAIKIMKDFSKTIENPNKTQITETEKKTIQGKLGLQYKQVTLQPSSCIFYIKNAHFSKAMWLSSQRSKKEIIIFYSYCKICIIY